MKALIINNEIKRKFNLVPKFLQEYANVQRIDLLSEQELIDRGIQIVAVDEPVYDSYIEELDNERFDSTANKVIFDIIAKVLPTLEEAKTLKIHQLKRSVKELYQSIQWYLEMLRANDETVPTAVKDKIQLIRTKYLAEKAAINSLTDVVDVIKHELPLAAIASLQEQLDSID